MMLVIIWALFVHLFMVARWRGSGMGGMCVNGGVGHREGGVLPTLVLVTSFHWCHLCIINKKDRT